MAAPQHFRAFARRAINLPSTVATQADGPTPARLINLGLGGACIEVSAVPPVAPGTVVTVEVTAPNLWDPLVVLGKIAWVHHIGPGTVHAGVVFDHTRKGKAALPALVELLVAYRYE
jgi:PilZ domain-containing protein